MRKAFRPLALLLVLPAAVAFAAEAAAPATPQEPPDLAVLAKMLATPLKLLRGDTPTFSVTFEATYTEGEAQKTGKVVLVRPDADRFGLSINVEGLTAELVREKGETRLVVPPKQVALVGKGPLPEDSPLDFDTLFRNLAQINPKLGAYTRSVRGATPDALALILGAFAQIQRVPPAAGENAPPTFRVGRVTAGELTLAATPDGDSVGSVVWKGPRRTVTLAITIAEPTAMPKAATEGLTIVAPHRAELEWALGRGLVRAVDVLYYNNSGDKPRDEVRKADAARLIVKKGGRVAVLAGTSYAIGFQHGKLLAREARRLCDAVLYGVGLAYSIEKKEWFLDTMRGAFRRLKPHIPREYLDEMRGLADGIRSEKVPASLEEVHLANVFPALFHCSGFAILPEATATKKLYHGRVLDYMTEVGLQRDAVLFVVMKRGCIPFANVGYAGFIGSVTGMNSRSVCFGEMGGGGVGQWDGTPMPILMRMGLERAGTLAQAMDIFKKAKRTCEYYYVISDSKIPDAVGVKATPETIEFVKPGQKHPLLPTPVEHCVLLSRGDRYKTLVARVKAKLGKLNAIECRKLMSRGVAMRSNLHSVLFVPKQLHIYVANARGSSPAYKQHYIRYNFADYLGKYRPKRPFPKGPGISER